MRPSGRHGAQAGFTLLEVVVALVIAALALGVLYRGAIGGIGSARVAAQVQDAVGRARSRLAAVGHGAAIAPGEESGADGGGFRWRTRVAVVQTAAPAPAGPAGETPPPRLALFSVAVAISWGEGAAARQVQLDTLRVGFTAPAPP